MKSRFLTGSLSTILLFAPLVYSQTSATKAADDAAPAASDAATAEAKRQGRVALTTSDQSPTQSMSQAIAFERYKELAAEREARKGGTTSNADRSVESPQPAKVVKKN